MAKSKSMNRPKKVQVRDRHTGVARAMSPDEAAEHMKGSRDDIIAARRAHKAEKTNGLPEDCPVTPLGVDGYELILITASGGHTRIDIAALSRNIMIMIFGGKTYLETAWPIYGAPEMKGGAAEIIGFNHEQVRDALIEACSAKGPYKPATCADAHAIARFKVGDVVQLKSGGPGMTVNTVDCGSSAEVMWFHGGELKSDEFPMDCLAPYAARHDDNMPF